MASASTPSANEHAKDLIVVHTVQLKQMIKAQFSRRMVSSGTSDSVHSEKTRLKKWREIIIGERAKRARHSQVCSIENRILS